MDILGRRRVRGFGPLFAALDYYEDDGMGNFLGNPFVWNMSADTLQLFTKPVGFPDAYPTDITADGQCVIGIAGDSPGFSIYVPVRWDSGVPTVLDYSPFTYGANVTGVSDDKSIIVGHVWTADPTYSNAAVYWDNGVLVISASVPMGWFALPGFLSPDGTKALTSTNDGTDYFVQVWDLATDTYTTIPVPTGPIVLPFYGGVFPDSVSADFSVICGTSKQGAWYWTAGTGTVVIDGSAFGVICTSAKVSRNGLYITGSTLSGGDYYFDFVNGFTVFDLSAFPVDYTEATPGGVSDSGTVYGTVKNLITSDIKLYKATFAGGRVDLGASVALTIVAPMWVAYDDSGLLVSDVMPNPAFISLPSASVTLLSGVDVSEVNIGGSVLSRGTY